MIVNKVAFDRQIYEAWNHNFSGWNFAYVAKRIVESPLPWDYRNLVVERIKAANSLLDLDTGGGEFLSSLQPLPKYTFATEGYAPNIPIAKEGLEPLGVKVIGTVSTTSLPFEDDYFDLVINRHGSINASEIHRILKSGKRFITQQVGGRNNIELNELLQDEVKYEYSGNTLEHTMKQLKASGLIITDQREVSPETAFMDIGAVVYYLSVVPWQVRDFTIEKYYDKLMKIQEIIEEQGKFMARSHGFLIEAQKR